MFLLPALADKIERKAICGNAISAAMNAKRETLEASRSSSLQQIQRGSLRSGSTGLLAVCAFHACLSELAARLACLLGCGGTDIKGRFISQQMHCSLLAGVMKMCGCLASGALPLLCVVCSRLASPQLARFRFDARAVCSGVMLHSSRDVTRFYVSCLFAPVQVLSSWLISAGGCAAAVLRAAVRSGEWIWRCACVPVERPTRRQNARFSVVTSLQTTLLSDNCRLLANQTHKSRECRDCCLSKR